jgi:MFS family permease
MAGGLEIISGSITFVSSPTRSRSLFGVISAMAVVNLVYGITFPLFAMVLDAQGISKTLIGLNTMIQALAIVILAPVAPRILNRFQPAKIMQITAVVLAGLFILAGLFPNVWFWFPLRFVIGAITAMLWISSEAMINSLAQERWRGRIIGIYSAAGAAGFSLAPIILILTGTTGMLPFVATSLATLLAAIPLFWSTSENTVEAQSGGPGIAGVILLIPAVMLGNIAYAAVIESIGTFFPLYGQHLGLDTHFALMLMTLLGVGGMVLVMPLGWIADHINRFGMLLFCVIFTMAGLLAMPYLVVMPVISIVFMFIFGGVSAMIYTLGVILIGEQFKGAMLATATTAFTACWGIGSVIGPLIAGVGMDLFGVEHMALIIFALFIPYLPFPVRAWMKSREISY